MRAVVLEHPAPLDRHPLSVRELRVPEPGPGQVLLHVQACGVCRSNLHMVEGDWLARGVPAKQPIVPGHEVVGIVVEAGPGVDWPPAGLRVGVQPLWSTCMRCDWCLTGREHLCPKKEITGETVDGGYAEYMVATASHAYAVPEGWDSAEAAPLFCPGVTAYGAVQQAQLDAGSKVAVFGIGGVGHMVVQMAALCGSEVIAVSRSAHHLELARSLGATRVVDSGASDPAHELRREGGVDAAIVFAPSDAALRQAIAAVKPGGRIVAGVRGDVGTFPSEQCKTLVGTVIGPRHHMDEVLRLAAAGKLRVVVERAPLEEAEGTLRRLRDGDVAARAVLTIPWKDPAPTTSPGAHEAPSPAAPG